MAPSVFLFAHTGRDRVRRVAERLGGMLRSAGHGLVTEPEQAGLIISVGGDGTLLDAVSRWRHLNTAFLGVNAGHLGFLQEAGEEDLEDAVERLTGGHYDLVSHPLLETTVVAVQGGEPIWSGEAFNDVVVERQGTRTLRLSVRFDGAELGPLVGDGILTANPAGSTAYALAAGGAVAAPDTDVIQVLPLNPHPSRLARMVPRPVLVGPTTVIEVVPDWTRDRPARLVVDGEEQRLPPDHAVRIRRGPRGVRMVRLGLHSFWSRLQAKFT